MLILALDTATEQGNLALWAGDRVLGELSLKSPGTYLQHLLPGVEALLKGAGRRLEELTAIAVSQGPGNFTGLRIGLATAQGLAWSLGLPLAGVPTLEVLAGQFPFQPQPVAALVDAKRGEVYLGRYRVDGAEPEPQGEPRRLPLAALARELTPPLLLTGPGLTAHEAFLLGLLSPGVLLAPPELRYPRAATLARLAALKLARGLIAPPHQLTPLYLRPAL